MQSAALIDSTLSNKRFILSTFSNIPEIQSPCTQLQQHLRNNNHLDAYDVRIHFCFCCKMVSLHSVGTKFVSELNGTEIFIEKNLQLRFIQRIGGKWYLPRVRKRSSISCAQCHRKKREHREKRRGSKTMKTVHNTCSVSTVAPIISSHVSPLKNALGASQIVRQFVESLEDLVSWTGIISDRSILRLK